MKRLMFLRHAKAVQGAARGDHDRDLAPRGVRDAGWAATAIHRGGWRPDLALVSDARRTRRTFDLVADAVGVPPRLRLEPRLYDASPETILTAIARTAADVDCLLVIGHNPGIADTARRLARRGDETAGARLAQGYPTASLAVIELEAATWSEVTAGGTLVEFLSPP